MSGRAMVDSYSGNCVCVFVCLSVKCVLQTDVRHLRTDLSAIWNLVALASRGLSPFDGTAVGIV